jgi:gas vesicle protein
MADGYDRFDNDGGGGGSFVMGLLTGTVLGAGLGMLFAPKTGSELRGQLSEQAGNLANTASEGYRRAQESAGDLADRGRELYDKARDAMSRGAEEAQRYVRDAASDMPGSPAPASGSTSGSSYSSGSEHRSSSSSEYKPGGSQSGGTRRS